MAEIYEFEHKLDEDCIQYVEFLGELDINEVSNIKVFEDAFTLEDSFPNYTEDAQKEITDMCHAHLEMLQQLSK